MNKVEQFLSAELLQELRRMKREQQAEYGYDVGASPLGEWDAGDDTELPSPRGWLLGNIFCRRFMSSLIADGGVGKTALRYAQLMSCAIGRSLTGEHVFQRCRVLIVSLEKRRRRTPPPYPRGLSSPQR
jgi:RecA-family ATPase